MSSIYDKMDYVKCVENLLNQQFPKCISLMIFEYVKLHLISLNIIKSVCGLRIFDKLVKEKRYDLINNTNLIRTSIHTYGCLKKKLLKTYEEDVIWNEVIKTVGMIDVNDDCQRYHNHVGNFGRLLRQKIDTLNDEIFINHNMVTLTFSIKISPGIHRIAQEYQIVQEGGNMTLGSFRIIMNDFSSHNKSVVYQIDNILISSVCSDFIKLSVELIEYDNSPI